MKLQITIAGKVFDVGVDILDDEDDEQAAPAAQAAPVSFAMPSMPGHTSDVACMSPVNGLVIKVLVTPGQSVQANEALLMLEAMKMETPVTAPRACTIKSVKVAAGQAVKTGQLLVEFE